MKKLFFLFIAFILIQFTTPAQQGWFYQSPDPTFENLNSVYFVNNNIGWAVGNANTIIKTTDGGESWANELPLGETVLTSVQFFDQNKGCAVGYEPYIYPPKGKILFTSVGGETWDSANVNISLKLNCVFFASEQVVYTVGEEATVLKSTDGGINWNDVGMDSSFTLNSLFFINENTGWVAGDFRRILKTTNGGMSWENQSSSNYLPHFNSIYFLNSNMGWAAGGDIVAITNDGGETWTEISTGYFDQKSIVFENENTGYIAGNNWTDGFILKSTDGGTTWDESFTSEIYFFNSLAKTIADNIFAVSEKGGIIATTNGGSQWQVKTKYIDAGFTALCFINENVGVVSGYCPKGGGEGYGNIYKSIDGGNSWVLKDSIYKVAFVEICFVDESRGWMIGENWDIGAGTLLHTTDGGESWFLQHSFSGMLGESVCFVNEMSGWVVGTDGKIYHTSDSGSNWYPQNSGVTNQLWDVYFTDELNGWTVGVDVLKTTDGGNSWINVTPSGHIFNFLTTVQFVNDSIGWTLGDNGTLLKSTDAGDTWYSQWSSNSPHFRSLYFNDDLNGWIIGIEGPIYYTSDGGENWVLQSTRFMDYRTWSISMFDNTTGWVAGKYGQSGYPERGIILKTTTGGASFIEEIEIDEAPTHCYLSNNYPNPFNPSTKIRYSIPFSSKVIIKVFDVLGKEIETLVNEEKPVGTYELTWYAEGLPSGVYFYQLRSNDFVEMKKMILIK